MNFKTLLFFVFSTFYLNSQSIHPKLKVCDNKTDKTGKRKGSWQVFYKTYDWSTSKLNFFYDFNNLEEVFVKVNSDLANVQFIENVKYKNGLKSGRANYYSYNSKNNTSEFVASAIYKNGKISGEVCFYKGIMAKIPSLKILYENGVLKDQFLEGESVILKTLDGYEENILSIKNYEKTLSGKAVESQGLIDLNFLQNSNHYMASLAKRSSTTFEKYLVFKETTNAENIKSIVFIHLAKFQQTDASTQFQQQIKYDKLGKALSFSNITIYQTTDTKNFITSDEYTIFNNEKKQLKCFSGLNIEKSCLTHDIPINQQTGKPEGNVAEYYFNEVLEPKIPNNERKIKISGQFENGMLNGQYNVYYTDGLLAATMTYSNNTLIGRFNAFYNPKYNFIYTPNFPEKDSQISYDLGSEIDQKKTYLWLDPFSLFFSTCYVGSATDQFSLIGNVSNCNHVKPKLYKELIYACDFKNNKLASDIVYFLNEKHIVFRQKIDLKSLTKKDWIYYNLDGSECQTQSQAAAFQKAKKEKEEKDKKALQAKADAEYKAKKEKEQKLNNKNSSNKQIDIISEREVETGMCTLNNGNYTIEDTEGNFLLGGFGAVRGELMAFSSKIIVTQTELDTYVYTIKNGELKMIYGGNGFVLGTVVNAVGTSFFTKGNWNCKYTIIEGQCVQDYCKSR